MDAEHFRGAVGGVSSMLLPADMIARHLGLLGITPQTTVILVPSDKLHDATLIAMALERVGHTRYAILNGGWDQWAAEKRPVDTRLPDITATDYPLAGQCGHVHRGLPDRPRPLAAPHRRAPRRAPG